MSISEQIFNAGIVGCGGAGFPTHVKLQGKAAHLIVNGAECEPLLCTDRYIMRHFAAEIITAAASLSAELGADCTIALKRSYSDEIATLRHAIETAHAQVKLYLLDSFYPAGDEQTLVFEVTGQVVPPAGLPLDVGCVVANAATMLSVHDAMEGRPFTHKHLTVTGAVERPAIVRAPLGTSLTECLELTGGSVIRDYCALLGGPMMGRIISAEDFNNSVVTKTVSGVVILPSGNTLSRNQAMTARQVVLRASAACIRCSRCSELCPRALLGHPLEPHRIMRSLALCGDIDSLPLDDSAIQSAALCCECGVCELAACPMSLQPRQINAALKVRLIESGFRYRKGKGQTVPHPLREYRKLPTARAAARAGVYEYNSLIIGELATAQPDTVHLPLRQSSGVPAEPIVADGQQVQAGQLIAHCPDGKLGSNLHASISGNVRLENDSIIILGKGGRV